MNIVCLTPTYGRPSLVASSVAMFRRQRVHGLATPELWILDDAGQIPAGASSDAPTYRVASTSVRFPTLPSKYAELVTADNYASAVGVPVDAWLVWDDDDVYLPNHIEAYARTLEFSPWAHPEYVYSTYGVDPVAGLPRIEAAGGRFHGALGIRADALRHIGGWIQTDRATFDQEMLAKCRRELGEPGDPCQCADGDPTYVYRWGDSGGYHCSGNMGRADWYDLTPVSEPAVDQLVPRLDPRAAWILDAYEAGRLKSRTTAPPADADRL